MKKLLQTLSDIVGDNGLLTGDDVSARPLNWMGQGNRQALAIVRPSSTQEVSDIMKACNKVGQSVVTLGGMTGLVARAIRSSKHLTLTVWLKKGFALPIAIRTIRCAWLRVPAGLPG